MEGGLHTPTSAPAYQSQPPPRPEAESKGTNDTKTNNRAKRTHTMTTTSTATKTSKPVAPEATATSHSERRGSATDDITLAQVPDYAATAPAVPTMIRRVFRWLTRQPLRTPVRRTHRRRLFRQSI